MAVAKIAAAPASAFAPTAMPEELTPAVEVAPANGAVDPHAIDEYRAVIVVGIIGIAAIGIVPAAIGIAHRAARRTVIVVGVTAQSDADGHACLSGRAGCKRSKNGNRTKCDISQLFHVAPLRLRKRPDEGGVPRPNPAGRERLAAPSVHTMWRRAKLLSSRIRRDASFATRANTE